MITGTPVERGASSQLRRLAEEHRLLVGLVVLYAGIVWIVLRIAGLRYLWHPIAFAPVATALTVAWLACLLVIAFDNRSVKRSFTLDRLVGGCLIYVLGVLTSGAFSGYKQAMFRIFAFRWDESLARANMWLHGGIAPGAWLALHLPTAAIVALDRFYLAGWGHTSVFTTIAFTWSAHRERRQQFMVGQLLLWWVGGTAFASVFASGGPCYYRELTGGDTYLAMLARLDSVGRLWARALQANLWSNAATEQWHAFGGISAMPSMHVGVAAFIATAWWPHGAWARAAGVLFVLLTLVGSVTLGWHYAIDGYVSVALAPLCWWIAGRLVQSPIGPVTARNFRDESSKANSLERTACHFDR